MMCLWTKRQRERFLKRAGYYEATLVLACDSGTISAKDALNNNDCKVMQALKMDGVINATTTIRFLLTISMEPHVESSDELEQVGHDIERGRSVYLSAG
jgi:hypothetical protein